MPPVSSRMIHILLSLGILALVLIVCIPLVLSSHVRQERARRSACERHERIDCEPSIVWMLMK